MTNIVRKPRNEQSYFLEVPKSVGQLLRDAEVSERGERIYSKLDLEKAVETALARGRQEAIGEHQAYRDDIQRGYERAFEIIEEGSRQLQQAREKATAGVTAAILDLAYRLAERIVRTELPRTEGALPRLLDELLTKLADPGPVVVRVAPSDCRPLLELQGSEISRWPNFEFRSDGEIEPGGCVIETETGCWDARVESQLAEIYREISRISEAGVGESEAAA